MKRVMPDFDDQDIVLLSDLDPNIPIFVKLHGKLVGVVVKEDKGWIVRLGGEKRAMSHHPNRGEILMQGTNIMHYTFHVES